MGGVVTLSATVKHATSCVFTSTKSVQRDHRWA
jgi:hypothetical protein